MFLLVGSETGNAIESKPATGNCDGRLQKNTGGNELNAENAVRLKRSRLSMAAVVNSEGQYFVGRGRTGTGKSVDGSRGSDGNVDLIGDRSVVWFRGRGGLWFVVCGCGAAAADEDQGQDLDKDVEGTGCGS